MIGSDRNRKKQTAAAEEDDERGLKRKNHDNQHRIHKQRRMRRQQLTIQVPDKGIPHLLMLDIKLESNGDKLFSPVGIINVDTPRPRMQM